MSLTTTSADTQVVSLIATRKLPDDTTTLEFASITQALGDLVDSCAAIARAPREARGGGQVLRVQYGSDFFFVIAVASGLMGVILAAAKAVKVVAEAAEANANAHVGMRTAEKVEMETDILRVELEARKLALQRDKVQWRIAAANAFEEGGFPVAHSVLNPLPKPIDASSISKKDVSQVLRPTPDSKLAHALEVLAQNDIHLHVEEG